MKKILWMFGVAVAGSLILAPVTMADRGGWADPPGGWTFVEEWHKIPDYENDPVWNHNNGSDSYSGNAHTEDFNLMEVYIQEDVLVGDVVQVETLEGVGETEDGVTPAEDAIAMRLIDLGDPRELGLSDPSDRKIFFLGALHAPGELTEDPFLNGITFCARFRIFPIIPDRDIGAGQDLVEVALDPDGDGVPDGDGTLRFIPEASDRAHVGIGFYNPSDTTQNVLVGVGYYTQGTMSVLVNNLDTTTDPEDHGLNNTPILTEIDTTAFHSVWISAKADPDDPTMINVRAFGDGSTEAVEAVIQRGSDAVDLPNPEDLQDNAEWSGIMELAFNIGSAGTDAAGGFQYDYILGTMAGAYDPQPAGSTDVASWDLY
ncbi:MAG: hypothetical protein JXR73_01330 [Candidatus Omnitrophica bacterium]|nr:hypothetical protein [Candidatus Omnitrophota bacterium]